MVKVFVFYDSKYGNTKVVAEKIVDGLKKFEGIDVDMGYIKEVNLQNAICSDLIILGAPNHMASPSRAMKNFIERLASSDLKADRVAVFGTYSGRFRSQDRAEKKLESLIAEKMPQLRQVLPGLSVKVKGVTGPLAEGELSRSVEFGAKIADQLKT